MFICNSFLSHFFIQYSVALKSFQFLNTYWKCTQHAGIFYVTYIYSAFGRFNFIHEYTKIQFKMGATTMHFKVLRLNSRIFELRETPQHQVYILRKSLIPFLSQAHICMLVYHISSLSPRPRPLAPSFLFTLPLSMCICIYIAFISFKSTNFDTYADKIVEIGYCSSSYSHYTVHSTHTYIEKENKGRIKCVGYVSFRLQDASAINSIL